MRQSESPNSRQLPIVPGIVGALAGAAFFFGITMDIAVAAILGAPIGLLVGIIAWRAFPRIMTARHSRTDQLNGAAPALPTVEERTKPTFKMKIKN